MNALSEKLDLNIYRDGNEYEIKFKDGNSIKPLKKLGKTKKKGTKITFLPSKQIFSSTKFSATILEKRIRELAFLNKGIAIKLMIIHQKNLKNYYINMMEAFGIC